MFFEETAYCACFLGYSVLLVSNGLCPMRPSPSFMTKLEVLQTTVYTAASCDISWFSLSSNTTACCFGNYFAR